MKPTVLVVDDSSTVRANLRDTLEGAGFLTALTGTLTQARQALAAGSFSLVVLDVMLPDGDGIDLLAEIRRTPAIATLPVMLLSTETEVRDRVRGLTTGADEYVGKPYDVTYLLERAHELTRRYALERPAIENRNVLIIDDSPTFRHALGSALVASGYNVVAAVNGEEGLKTAAEMRPRALIVDGVMPGIDGTTVIRRVRMDPTLRRMPCLLLTGSDAGGGELQALDAGADAYVRKNEDMAVILARFMAVVRHSEGATAVPERDSGLRPRRILAVDDSPTYLALLADELRAEGHEPVLARSGDEALELLVTNPVECILLDLRMPGLSGEETCRRIKSSPAWRDIPLMILTALDESEAMIAGINAGADDYVVKSASFDVLRARLRAQLRRKQFEKEHRQIREELLQAEIAANEARAANALAQARAELLESLEQKNQELERANRDLESFSYSVSHDLRAPLRSIDGFSQAILEDYGQILDDEGRGLLRHVRESAQHMGHLIDDLLGLARVARGDLSTTTIDLSGVAKAVVERLRRAQPGRECEVVIAGGVVAEGDARLLGVVLENLIGNAWKFTAKQGHGRIEVGCEMQHGERVYFVRDNGAGFDMTYAEKLFGAFQRLHAAHEFEGTGIGLATVARIIDRHGGRVWAHGAVGQGATFYFTLGSEKN